MITSNLRLEQSTRMVGQILDDYDRLKEEFLALNLEEVIEKRPDLVNLIILNLINIRNYSNVAYTFLDAIKIAITDND